MDPILKLYHILAFLYPKIPLDAPGVRWYIMSMKKALFALFLMVLSLHVFASDWSVRWDRANVRKEPSIKAMLVYTIQNVQHAKITDIDESAGWLKVRFDAYVSQKEYKYLRLNGAEIKRLGWEGDMVQVNIKGWTRKDNLRERVEE